MRISNLLSKRKHTIFALWGIVLIVCGFSVYLLTALVGFFRVLAAIFIPINKIFLVYTMWYSALPVVLGFLLIFFDLFFVVNLKRSQKKAISQKMKSKSVTVVLTAYNDEKSIGLSVKDFLGHKFVKRVIVVSNNSQDNTMVVARKTGAIVFNETLQGYGACVYRALAEGLKCNDSEIICLCEGDMTFRSADLDKFMSYIDHADIVNGTRIVDQLQEAGTQITTFIHYGNFAVAKLLESKYLGSVTLTDVGTTYKVIRKSSLKKLLPKLNKNINLEFNPHFLEEAIKNNLAIVECPINFYPRVGVSKGGNVSNQIAFNLGLRMIKGIIFGWKKN